MTLIFVCLLDDLILSFCYSNLSRETGGLGLASTITLALQANRLTKCTSHPKEFIIYITFSCRQLSFNFYNIIFTGVYIQNSWATFGRRECFNTGVFLEPVNIALVVTREFVILGVTEFGFSGVIIGAVELLANSICGTGETRSFCTEKMSHSLNCFFFVDYHVLFN